MNLFLELLVSVLLIATALAIARVRGLFAIMVLLSAFSGLMAVLFALLGAVDVSFTEAVVGTGVSTLFLMALIRAVDPAQVGRRPASQRGAALVVAAFVAGLLIFGVWSLPHSYLADSPTASHVGAEYSRRAYDDMHTPNVVTAVLADYRSFDTLIEAAVVATAALSCLLILYRGNGRE